MRRALAASAAAVLMLFIAARAEAECGRPEKRHIVNVREIAVGNDGDFRFIADVTGGEPPYTYRWKGIVGDDEFTSTERMTPIFRPYHDRYAEVEVRDRTGCVVTTPIGKDVALAKRGCGLTEFEPLENPGTIQSTGLEISFPGGGVRWRVGIENRGLKGVALGRVEMQRPGETTWNSILKAAGPTEIYVAYHNGTTWYYDMQHCAPLGNDPHPCLRQVSLVDTAPIQAKILTFPGSTYATVAAECRDEGLAALCRMDAPRTGFSTRYKEVVLWSVYDTGNYDYVIQYGFRNDGTIRFRAGATGFNNTMHPLDPHMHTVLWRVDPDLFGVKGHRVYQVAHQENPGDLHATDSESFYATEGTLNWSAEQFSSLLIEGGLNNAVGNRMGYELSPWDRKGTATHYRPNDKWTHTDFWVTVNNPGEDGTGNFSPNNWGQTHVVPDLYLSRYVAQNANLNPNSSPQLFTAASDTVVWYRSAAHHHPRDEDRRIGDAPDWMSGITLMHWQGFDFEPHNVFTENPLMPTNGCI